MKMNLTMHNIEINNLEDYRNLAARTLPDLGSKELNLHHMFIGIQTEIAELQDVFKKHIVYGKDIDWVNVVEEWADIMWYIAGIHTIEGIQLEDYAVDIYDSVTALSISKELLKFNTSSYMVYDDKNKLEYSISDVMVLERLISKLYDFNKYTALANNINKLRIRFPDKFDTEKALNRDLDSERLALEQK